MKHVHFLGINGSGASAIAHIAKAEGYNITGCADKEIHNEFTQDFDKDTLQEGHSPSHLDEVDILAITPAVLMFDPGNAELKAAKEKGIEVLTWQQFMGKYLEEGKFVIAVCGTHGKSTTTAMIGKLLEDAGLDPTVELGAIVPEWGANFRVGKGKYFVTEADEYNDNFLPTHPDIAVVTNIEMDHPEYFRDLEDVKDSFFEFLMQSKVAIVANIKDTNIAEILKDLMKESKITCIDYSKNEINFPLSVIGEFNKQNASAVFQVGLLLGIDPSIIQRSLSEYSGISKRFEKMGEFNGAQIYTDFGHHPTEVEVTIKAIREKFPSKKLWIIFQPHMFSRTKGLFNEFVKVFKEAPADGVWITDIYHAREEDRGLVTSQELVKAINLPGKIDYIDFEEIEESIKGFAGEGDVLVFMGAGVVDQIGKELINAPK
jgi:UDP-N-acetylmuramate--alanine ligase